MFIINLHPKLFFLPILGSLPSSGEAKEEVIRPKPSRKFLAALTLILKQKLKRVFPWKYVDQATDLAKLKWSRVGEVQRSVTGKIWLSCLKRSVWKYILKERVDYNDDFSNICSFLDYN